MLNSVVLIGRLGNPPELRATQGGESVANFSIATSESWKGKNGQKQERTEWHRIVVWGKLAELCSQYLGKGKLVGVTGSLQTRKWEDKNGATQYTTEIRAREVKFLSPPEKTAPAQEEAGEGCDGHEQDIGF